MGLIWRNLAFTSLHLPREGVCGCAVCARRCEEIEYDLKRASHCEGDASINGMCVFGSVEPA